MRTIWLFIGLIVSILVAGFIAGGLAAAAVPDSTAGLVGNGNGTSITESGASITFVFDRDFAPYTYEENDFAQGFELDLLRLIGEEEGFLVFPKPMIWADARLSFQHGDADVIGGLVKTEERLRQYNFTALPHGTFDILTFVLEDSDIKSSDMLKGRRVAVEDGSISLDLLRNRTGIQAVAYDSEGEGLRAMLRGDVDAFVGGGSTTWYRINQQNISGVRALAIPWEMHSVYFGARDPELLQSLDRGLEKMVQSGRYDQLYRRWFVRELSGVEALALVNASRQAGDRAYAPYSRYTVGSAVLTASGRIYTGCNVENALYGLTASALEVAVFKAISEGDSSIRAVANYLPDGRLAAPTGDERQILYEFGRGILVILGDDGNYTTEMVSEIFPYPFEMRD